MPNLSSFQHKFYEPEISGLRGLAILIVVVGHFVQRIERFATPTQVYDWKIRLLIDTISCPAAGVYLFFSISGYLISQNLSRKRRLDSIVIGRFYLRRLIRVAVPYSFVLFSTCGILYALAWEPPRTNLYNVKPESLFESLLASLTYVHGIAYGTYPRLFPPGWTLEVEVQFYFIAPFLYVMFRHLATRTGLRNASSLALGVAGVVALGTLSSGPDRLQSTVLVYMPFFFLGIIAYNVRQTGWRPTSRLTPALGWIAVIGFIILQPWASVPGIEIAARIVLIAVMFSAVAAERGSFYVACINPTLGKIGIVSYSIYLVHLQITHLVQIQINKYFIYINIIPLIILSAIISSILIYFATKLFYFSCERPAIILSRVLSKCNALPNRFLFKDDNRV